MNRERSRTPVALCLVLNREGNKISQAFLCGLCSSNCRPNDSSSSAPLHSIILLSSSTVCEIVHDMFAVLVLKLFSFICFAVLHRIPRV